MANVADSTYRFFGSEETLNTLMSKINIYDRFVTVVKNLGGDPTGSLRGEVCWTQRENNWVWMDAITDWNIQPDFIHCMHEIFKDDKDFRIEWRCSEPGNQVFYSNVRGAIDGEYIGFVDEVEEHFSTDGDTMAYFDKWAKAENVEHPEWEDFEDMQEWLEKWSDEHDNRYVRAFKFDIEFDEDTPDE